MSHTLIPAIDVHREAIGNGENDVTTEVLKATNDNEIQAAGVLRMTRRKRQDLIRAFRIVLESNMAIHA
ncbi:hypothetical protein [Novipirellula galeiformis]|uniref:hypothetical protein n=1 Tax=Novipirellula galeiformis TaxID=2528004 RepID=UPI0011B6DB96|nr:hypothetical protein [Novipirellula galeiformis]